MQWMRKCLVFRECSMCYTRWSSEEWILSNLVSTILFVDCYKHYVIIPKPHSSSREEINYHCNVLIGHGHLCDSVRRRSTMTVGLLTAVAGSFKWIFGRHCLRDSVWKFFAYKKARPNWDANSWHDVLSDDRDSYRHFPRRSSKNRDLPFANTDRQTDRLKENYSIDNEVSHTNTRLPFNAIYHYHRTSLSSLSMIWSNS